MKLRKLLKITSRTSSVTNSFVQAIIPTVVPTRDEQLEALGQLGQSEECLECVYCGSKATDWDHLHPLVRDKRPTGYINEIRNLVPSCAPCNQSKGGANWKQWMLSAALGSPTSRKIVDVAARVIRLEGFAEWGNLRPLSLEGLAGPELWASYWEHLDAVHLAMENAQRVALQVQVEIQRALNISQPQTRL